MVLILCMVLGGHVGISLINYNTIPPPPLAAAGPAAGAGEGRLSAVREQITEIARTATTKIDPVTDHAMTALVLLFEEVEESS